MTVLQSAFFGFIQGITEFLPVSSSAHLILFQEWFGTEEPELLFNVSVHLGTLFAICFAFRKTVSALFREAIHTVCDVAHRRFSWKNASSGRKMLFWLLLSLLPLLIVAPFKKFLDPLLVSPLIAGICLIFNSFVLLLCDMVPTGKKTAKDLTWRDSLFVGIIQCAAILPGLSRSGSTITAGVCRGMKRSVAAKYSFILSIPTVIGSVLIEWIDAVGTGINPSEIPLCLIGMLTAALSGLGAIALLKKILKSKRFIYFALYSFVVGIAAIVFTR